MAEKRVPLGLDGEELAYEVSLRPRSLDQYIGQEKIKENLRVCIEAARQRGEHLDHVLFYGPPGLGKTTLANIIAAEMASNIKATSGPVMERAGDLAAILTNMADRDILFVDEIHRLNRVVEEMLYPAMEDYKLDLIIGQGPSARTIKLDLPRFTLVGATTRAGLITSPLLDRFGLVHRLDYYNIVEIEHILKRSALMLDIPIDDSGCKEIARRARGTPRIANRLLRRVRDYAQVRADGAITASVADAALRMLDVDEAGLDKMDRKLISTIIEKFNGGPVGVETIAAAIGEEKDTIEDVLEPYLIQEGFIKRTLRGRVATKAAFQHLGIKYDEEGQGKLFE